MTTRQFSARAFAFLALAVAGCSLNDRAADNGSGHSPGTYVSGLVTPYLYARELSTMANQLRPRFVATSDMNGDGIPDVIAAHDGEDAVHVWLGTGDGTPGVESEFPAGIGPRALAVADVDNDGFEDVVTADTGGETVSVLLGNGDGTLRPPTSYVVGKGPRWVSVGDFNEDGILDLIASNDVAKTVTLLLGKVGGGYAAATPPGLRPMLYAGHCVVADVNGDSHDDLVVTDVNASNRYVFVLLGKGDGTFGAPIPSPYLGLRYRGPRTLVSDVNRDGKPDLVTTVFGHGRFGIVAVLLGRGDGTFDYKSYSGTFSKGPILAALADVNGDMAPDIVMTEPGSDDVDVLLNDGKGAFGITRKFKVALGPESAAVADVNGDGKPDLISAGERLSVSLGVGDGTFPTHTEHGNESGQEPSALAIADFNGDGHLDVATANAATNDVSVLLGPHPGGGTFPSSFAAGDRPIGVVAGDFNRDGKIDLVTANREGDEVTLLLGNGDGSFKAPTSFSIEGTSPTAIAAADFNGDGTPDLAVASDGVSVLLGNGDGTFAAELRYGLGADVASLAIGDVDGDGKPDLALGGDKTVGVFLGKGDGTFTAGGSLAIGSLPTSLVAGDVDRDGKLDLVAISIAGTEVLLNKGGGKFGAPIVSTAASGDRGDVADFDRDGILDVAVRTLTELRIVHGRGDGSFDAYSTYRMDAWGTPTTLVARDIDLDGKPDILSPNGSETGRVSLRINMHR